MPGKARALGLQTQRPAAARARADGHVHPQASVVPCLPHRYLLVRGSSEGFGDEGSGAVLCARERI